MGKELGARIQDPGGGSLNSREKAQKTQKKEDEENLTQSVPRSIGLFAVNPLNTRSRALRRLSR
jgi:hypothetical protein